MPNPSERIEIKICAWCRGDHLLFARPFTRSPDGATHWATCPTTGDPILIEQRDEALKVTCERCNKSVYVPRFRCPNRRRLLCRACQFDYLMYGCDKVSDA